MIGQKRKYDEEDKKKAKEYYLKNKDIIKERNKKYYEENKKNRFKGMYSKNRNTKKAKMLKNRINKINEKIKNLKKNDKKDLSFGLPQSNYETDEQKISLELKNRVAKEVKNRTDKLEERKNYFHYCRGEEREVLREEIRKEEILIKELEK